MLMGRSLFCITFHALYYYIVGCWKLGLWIIMYMNVLLMFSFSGMGSKIGVKRLTVSIFPFRLSFSHQPLPRFSAPLLIPNMIPCPSLWSFFPHQKLPKSLDIHLKWDNSATPCNSLVVPPPTFSHINSMNKKLMSV